MASFSSPCIYTAIVINTLFTNIKPISSQIMIFIVLGITFIIPVAELSVAMAVPRISRYPAILLCCGRTKQADHLVTTIVLLVDLANCVAAGAVLWNCFTWDGTTCSCALQGIASNMMC